MFKKLFIYACRVAGSLGAGSVSTQVINIANDSDFELKEIRTTGTNLVNFSISYATGENMSNISLNTGLIGAGQNALKLFDGVVIPKNSQLTVLIDNQSGGAVSNYEVQLIGFKLQ